MSSRRKRNKHSRHHLPTVQAAPAFVAAGGSWAPEILLCATILLVYVAVAWLTSGQPVWWVLDFVDGLKIFSIDDAYRYYVARSAWLDSDLYSWSYVLPVALLLDGSLSSLLAGDLFLIRCAHAVATVGALFALLSAARAIGLGRIEAAVSLLVLALMPLFVFVQLSFYGECWLVVLYSFGLAAWLHGRKMLAVLLFALLPLVRPEGIYTVVSVGLYLLIQRDFRLLALLLAPGVLYAGHLLLVLDRLVDYIDWRVHLVAILEQIRNPALDRPTGFLSAYNALWLLPSLGALLLPEFRRHWPVFAGVVLWFLFSVATVLFGKASFEARYLISVLPVLVLVWPLAVRRLAAWLGRGGTGHAIPAVFLLCVLSTLVVIEHSFQLDPLRSEYGGGRRWPVAGAEVSAMPFFGQLVASDVVARDRSAGTVPALLRDRPEIDTLLINDTSFFYGLDPDAIPAWVKVVYVPTGLDAAIQLLDGVFFGMYPGGDQYSYYLLGYGALGGPGKALYLGSLTAPGLTPILDAGAHSIYLLNYSRALDRQVLLRQLQGAGQPDVSAP